MPSLCRVLEFPQRFAKPSISSAEAAEIAARAWQDGSEVCEELLDPEALLAICSILLERREVSPGRAAELGQCVYRLVLDSHEPFALFDEREYILGELAHHTAVAHRLLGKWETADLWLDRAEANFRHVINPAPSLTNTAYVRLTIRYSLARYDDVLELLPSVLASFEKLGMRREEMKCRFLEALCVKALGRTDESLGLLRELRSREEIRNEPALLGHVLLNIGDASGALGQFEAAREAYEAALPVLASSNRPIQLAELQWSLGDTYRSQGNLDLAVAFYRQSQRAYSALKMPNYLAILRVVTAEALISMERFREAEWEILAALPTIEEQKMVPEGFAAVALLKESVRRRKTDPNALRELREHLQANR